MPVTQPITAIKDPDNENLFEISVPGCSVKVNLATFALWYERAEERQKAHFVIDCTDMQSIADTWRSAAAFGRTVQGNPTKPFEDLVERFCERFCDKWKSFSIVR